MAGRSGPGRAHDDLDVLGDPRASGPWGRYLRAGAGLIADGGLPYGEVLSDFTYETVSKLTGFSVSALYRRWGSQAAMWSAAVEHLVATEPEPLETLVLHQSDWLDSLDRIEAVMRLDAARVLMMALVPYRRPRELTELMRWRVRRAVVAMHKVVLWGQARDGWRLEVMSTKQLAIGLYAVAAGLARAGLLDQDIAATDMHVPGHAAPHGRLAYVAEVAVRRLGVLAADGDSFPVDRLATPPRPEVSLVTARQREVLEQVAALFSGSVIPPEGAEPAVPGFGMPPLREVTPSRVAHAAGVTHDSLRKVWATQDEYLTDLMRWLLASEKQAWVQAAAGPMSRVPFTLPKELFGDIYASIRATADAGTLAAWATAVHTTVPAWRTFAGEQFERMLTDYARLHREKVVEPVSAFEHPYRPTTETTDEKLLNFARIMLPTFTTAAWLNTIDPDFNAATITAGDGGHYAPTSLLIEAVALDFAGVDLNLATRSVPSRHDTVGYESDLSVRTVVFSSRSRRPNHPSRSPYSSTAAGKLSVPNVQIGSGALVPRR